MSLSFENLSANLQEMYCAISNTEFQNQPQLIANFSGNNIYDSQRGWGRLWRWIYNFIAYFDGSNPQQNNLKIALEKTDQSFKEQLTLLQTHFKKHETYLSNACKGIPQDKNAIVESSEAIVRWQNGILPFLIFVKKQDPRLQRIVSQNFTSPSQHNQEAPFSCAPEVTKFCKRYVKLINLQAYFKNELPFKALVSVYKQYKKTEHDEKEFPVNDPATVQANTKDLERWFEKIKSNSAEIGVKTIHEGLHSFLQHLLGPEVKPAMISAHLAYLIFALQGVPVAEKLRDWTGIFTLQDPQHMQWRSSIGPKSTVRCNGNLIKLGQAVGRKAKGLDKNVLFEIDGDSTKLVWIGHNRAILGLKLQFLGRYSEECTKKSFYQNKKVGVFNLLAVDTLGRCAIIEKLETSLITIPWKSKLRIDEKDKKEIVKIAVLLKESLDMPTHPNCLDARYVMYGKDRKLKFSKIPVLVPYSFNRLVDFALQVSNKNQMVYQEIITRSGIDQHKISILYKEVVKQTLAGEIIKARKLTNDAGSKDVRIIKRVRELSKKVLAWKSACQDAIKIASANKKLKKSAEDISKLINIQIQDWYDKTKSVGIIWPDTAKEVEKGIVDWATR